LIDRGLFLQSNSSFDIVNGQEFKESKRVCDAVCKDLKREGKGGFEHYHAITAEAVFLLLFIESFSSKIFFNFFSPTVANRPSVMFVYMKQKIQ
jgi:hypothetical protein